MSETLEKKLDLLRARLSAQLERSENPALLWSGGMDSTLLLFLAREMYAEIPAFQFRSDFRKSQLEFSNEIIKKFDIRSVYYAPNHRQFIADEKGQVSLIDTYSIGQDSLPVIRDLVHDDEFCALHLNPNRTHYFNFDYDLALVGWRRTDTHLTLGDFVMPREVQIGKTLFSAPLYDFLRDEVFELSRYLKIPESPFYTDGDEKKDTGNFVACSRCVGTSERVYCPKRKEEIPGSDWARQESFRAFREQFINKEENP